MNTSSTVKDKYSATWVSHSSISDFLKCQRLYYLRNVYKNPKTGRKMTIMTPPLALGQAVHEVIESLSILPVEERLKISLIKKLDMSWEKVSGKKGGFKTHEIEIEYRDRAVQMLSNLENNPGPILEKTVKIKSSMGLPNYFLSDEDNIILCGKIDWLKYNKKEDSVQIIDFKTGKNEEKADSLQLPIYLLIANHTQSKKVSSAAYWYLNQESRFTIKELPTEIESFEKVITVARRIKLARQINHFVCSKGGCSGCRPYERILNGEGELVNKSETNQDIYILKD